MKNLKLNVEAEQSVDFVSADADRLQQVIWNLVSNAVKFTPIGGSVNIIVYRKGEHVRIEVHDTGEGIPPNSFPTSSIDFVRPMPRRPGDTEAWV